VAVGVSAVGDEWMTSPLGWAWDGSGAPVNS
jgi:hypothetical protein